MRAKYGVETISLGQPPSAADSSTVPVSLSDDAFLGGKLQILQPEKGFRAGIDSVILAATIPAKVDDNVFESGIGTGVAALCLASRVQPLHITGIEVAGRYAMLGRENAERNNFASSIKIIDGDVKDAMCRDLTQWPEHGSFAHAYANPPFYDENKVQTSPDILKAKANAFDANDLETWIKVMVTMVASRGSVTLINRPEMLGDILNYMAGKLGAIRIAPIYPRQNEPASRIIVQAIKGSKGPTSILPGLVLHGEGSGFTPQAEAILRGRADWSLK